jgi:hypothetical protein
VNIDYDGRYTTFLSAVEQLPKQHHISFRESPG